MATATRREDMVTGEGVVVAVPVAGPAIRLLSGAIDAVVTVVVAVLLGLVLARLLGASDVHLDDALLAALSVVTAVALLVGFPVLTECLGHGRTLGKLLTGLRTVRDDGAPADARRILTRHLLDVVEVWGTTGAVAVVAVLFTRPTRRLGDMVAGTYVARDRIRLALPPEPPMPPALAGWAERADLHVPDDLAALVRASLAPRAGFGAEAEDRISRDLAARLLPCVRPAPPAGAPASDVVDAIMAERRRREERRLRQQESRRERLFPATTPHPSPATPHPSPATANGSASDDRGQRPRLT